MKLRNAWLCLCATLLFGAWHGEAQAGFKFGSAERIRFVQNVDLKGPAGEQLFLGRKIAEHHFLLPYSIEDQGYVLGVAGDSKRYFQLPQGPKLQAMQGAGLLPRPLPPYELDTMDRVMGHLLWILLPILILYGVWSTRRGGKKSTPPSADGAVPEAAPRPVTRFNGKEIKLPMTLYPSRKKLVLLLAGSLAFVAIGYFMVKEDPTFAYFGIGFFGLCALVFAAQLFGRGRLRTSLLIEAQQFTIGGFGRKTAVAWRDVERFRVANIGGTKMVGWNHVPGYTAQATGRAVSARLSGVEGALPDTFGMKAEELCDLMNEIKARSEEAETARMPEMA